MSFTLVRKGLVVIDVAIDNAAAAYAAGDAVGTKKTVSANLERQGSLVELVDCIISDTDSQGADYKIHTFSKDPTGISDNAVFDIIDADAQNYHGRLESLDANGEDFTGASASSAKASGVTPLPIQTDFDGNLYFQLETNGAVTYGAANSLSAKLILRKH